MEIQHSIEWFRKRLGNFTGSQIGLLMKKGKSDYFSDTAKTYIYQVASERDMNPEIINDDVEFEKYSNLTSSSDALLCISLLYFMKVL